MTKCTFRSASAAIALALFLMTSAEAAPWYRNTFVKLRAVGTQPVALPSGVAPRTSSVRPEPASRPVPTEVRVPETVKNLRRTR